MSWLWGAGLGFLRGGPLGAIAGGTLGHFITKKVRKKVQKRLPGIKNEDLFITSVVVILTRLASWDNQITARQVEAIYRFFIRNLDYKTSELGHINFVIRETLRVNPDLKPVTEKFLEASPTHYRGLILALGYQILLIENQLNEETEKSLNELARGLKVGYEEHGNIRSRFSLGKLKTPYSVLGISEKAGNEEIKKAYRMCLIENHPDRVAHLGESHVESAHLKFLEIQDAYKEIELTRDL